MSFNGKRYMSKGEQLRAKRQREYETKAAAAAARRAEVLDAVRQVTQTHYEALVLLNKLNYGNAIDQLDGLKLRQPSNVSDVLPGTRSRIEEYAARYERGEELWCSDDRDDADEDERPSYDLDEWSDDDAID